MVLPDAIETELDPVWTDEKANYTTHAETANLPISTFTNDIGYTTTDTTLTEAEVDEFVANNGYLTEEIDGSVTNELQDTSTIPGLLQYVQNHSTGTGTETDPVFTAWDKTTGITIEEDQIVNMGNYLTEEIDGDSTNELQILSISNDTIYLSNGGGYVRIPEDSSTVGFADGDSLVLKDASGVTRFVINPNTGTFKMMNNDTIWYQLRVQSPLSERINNEDGSYFKTDGSTNNMDVYRADGTLQYSFKTDPAPVGVDSRETTKEYDNSGTLKKETIEESEFESIGLAETTTEKEYNSDGSLSSEVYTSKITSPETTMLKKSVTEYKSTVVYDKDGNEAEKHIVEFKNGKLVKREIWQNGVKVFEENANTNNGYSQLWNNSLGNQTWSKNEEYTPNGFSQTFQQEGTAPPVSLQVGFDESGGTFTFDANQEVTGNHTVGNDQEVKGNQEVKGELNVGGGASITGLLGLNNGLATLGAVNMFNSRTEQADLFVQGTITAQGTKNFKIDHPLKPDKYLLHAAMESNEVMNFYSGNVVTNNTGYSEVILPEYFEAINTDFRYQLTVIGTFAQAIISKKIENNQFEIRTSEPNVEVSWQVTAKRADSYMLENPFNDEIEK